MWVLQWRNLYIKYGAEFLMVFTAELSCSGGGYYVILARLIGLLGGCRWEDLLALRGVSAMVGR